ncbi:hypothetical protein Mterra_01367 [Calidithermus terrae]|uniref:Uncharacterized protein n=1 Tax=Calidithermus terrae TaxID=1408545 RepID=A0A399ET60_9DEIN|nr:hypothetical protein [Calidithermus terrae]RIH86700.1 hypothetical protein Mterra_01367 [Calidithermus terrae]
MLPPLLQALNTLDLRAPTVEGKPGSGLTPPGGGVAPPIPIGGVPAPIDTVAPPLGWGQPPRPGETVSPFEVTTDGDSGNPTDNDEEKRKREEEQRRALEAKIRKEQEEARERAEAVCNRYGGGAGASCADYLRRQGESSFYESLSPEQRLHWWQTINKKLSEGSMGKKDLEVLTRFTESFSLGKGSNGLPVLNANNPGKLDPALLGLAAGLGIPLGNVPPGMQAGPRLPQNPGLQPPNLNLGPLITTVARVGTIIGIIISLPGDTPQGQPAGMQAGNVNVPDVYAMDRKKALERLEGLSPEVEKHLRKLRDEPNSQAASYWAKEIAGWLEQMEKVVGDTGKKTSEVWQQRINTWKKELGRLRPSGGK